MIYLTLLKLLVPTLSLKHELLTMAVGYTWK